MLVSVASSRFFMIGYCTYMYDIKPKLCLNGYINTPWCLTNWTLMFDGCSACFDGSPSFVACINHPNSMESHKIHVPSHQPENRGLTCDSRSHIPKIVKNPNSGWLNLDMSSQQSYCGSFPHSLLRTVRKPCWNHSSVDENPTLPGWYRLIPHMFDSKLRRKLPKSPLIDGWVSIHPMLSSGKRPCLIIRHQPYEKKQF